MKSPSRTRLNTVHIDHTGQDLPRIERIDAATVDSTVHTETSTEALTIPTGAKRSNAHLEDNRTDSPKKTYDARAYYEANKQEIDEWYDEQHTLKLGIPKYGKMKHSKDPWYIKVAAYRKYIGLVQSPKKKQKLNNGTAKPTQHPALAEEPPRRVGRPDQVRYSADRVPVPEFPRQIEDCERTPTGRYACSHQTHDPSRDCCRNGMDTAAKKTAIKKEKERWKAAVEKLIDEKQLDGRHRTWERWVTPRLREKYQPALFKEEEEWRERRKLERLEDERRRMEAKKQRSEKEQRPPERQFVQQRLMQQQRSHLPSPPVRTHQGICHYPPAHATPVQVNHPPKMNHRPRADPLQPPALPVVVREAGTRVQQAQSRATFVTPSQTHSQPLGKQSTPPDNRLRNASRVHLIEHMDHGMHRDTVKRQNRETVDSGSNCGLPTSSATSTQPVISAAPSRKRSRSEQTVAKERERKRARTRQDAGSGVQSTVPRHTSMLRPELPYLAELPQAFATGNKAVDEEMKRILEYAYQTNLILSGYA